VRSCFACPLVPPTSLCLTGSLRGASVQTIRALFNQSIQDIPSPKAHGPYLPTTLQSLLVGSWPLFQFLNVYSPWSRNSSVSIATGYGLDDRGVGFRVPVGSRIFSSTRRPDRFWGPPNLLSNWYRGFFSWG
jgi:hypothetical protein